MKQKIIESIEASRKHFSGKPEVNIVEYFNNLGKQMMAKDLDNVADELHKIVIEKLKTGGI